jgi:Domain of unknown function (DUF4259)
MRRRIGPLRLDFIAQLCHEVSLRRPGALALSDPGAMPSCVGSIGLKRLQRGLWASKPASDSCCNTGTIPILSLNHRVQGRMILGTWGTGLFSDDVACDVRNHYRDLLEDGEEDDAAIRLTVERFRAYLEESDGVALLALAVTQSKLGRLDPDIRDQALALLDRGADLEVWEEENPKMLSKRRTVLEKARAQLTGPQPARKRLRPPKRLLSGLAAGDILALVLPRRLALLRVVRVHPHRLGETPVLEELDFDGTDLPARDALERLGPRANDPISFRHPLESDTRFSAFVNQRIDWQHAGFQKVQTIGSRPGDEESTIPGTGISWAELAARYRRRAAQ